MKKVLVTGAAGAIGLSVIKNLLDNGKYEITALDLKNRHSNLVLKKYKKSINIVLGDITDRVLMEALVKDHDIIIHLAGALPPFASVTSTLSHEIDYVGTENIVRAISYYHPEAHLFFASTMSVYQGNNKSTVKSAIKIENEDYYSKAKYDSEQLIKEKIKNYTIYRLPLVLCCMKHDSFPLNGKLNERIEYITKEDVANAFVKGISKCKELNKKTYNVTSGKTLEYSSLIANILENYGLSFKFIIHRVYKKANFYNSICTDGDELNKIIKYRKDNINDYYKRIKDCAKRRKLRILLAKPFVRSLKK